MVQPGGPPAFDPLDRLDAVADGVAEVEGPAGAVLGLVLLDDGRQQAGLDRLGQAVDKMAAGQRGEGVGVHHHQFGLPEGAHHVLGVPEVDGGLAADGRIDHGQGGGGAVDEVDAPHVDGGGKAGEVPHHAAAHRDDKVAPAQPEVQHLPQHRLEGLEALAGLPLGHGDDGGLPALVGHLAGVDGGHPAVGDDGHPAVEVRELIEVLQRPPPQDDLVAAGAQVHGQLAAEEGFAHFVYTPNIRTVRQVRSSSRSRASLSARAGSPTSSA